MNSHEPLGMERRKVKPERPAAGSCVRRTGRVSLRICGVRIRVGGSVPQATTVTVSGTRIRKKTKHGRKSAGRVRRKERAGDLFQVETEANGSPFTGKRLLRSQARHSGPPTHIDLTVSGNLYLPDAGIDNQSVFKCQQGHNTTVCHCLMLSRWGFGGRGGSDDKPSPSPNRPSTTGRNTSTLNKQPL